MKAIYIEKCAATFLREGEGYRFAEPDYKQTIPNASERRRMSRIVKMGTSVGLACTSPQTEAILTATGLGCLADTEKFMQQMFERNDDLRQLDVFRRIGAAYVKFLPQRVVVQA